MRTVLVFALGAALLARADDGFLHNGVTAHRGNADACPENTLPAFESALALGADWIETDVCVTKDHRLVLSHDKDTGRTGDRRLVIAEATYAELQSVDVAAGFRARKGLTPAQCPPARMPLLEEALALIARQHRTRLSLHPKAPCVPEIVDAVRALKAEPWIGFNDGSLNTLRQAKTLVKGVPVFWDRNADADIAHDIVLARDVGVESLVVHAKGLTGEKAAAVRRAGLEVGVWTVNDAAALEAFLALGVQRVYTDCPERLLRLKAR